MVNIEDFKGKWDANDGTELDAMFAKRYGNDVNAFWLTRDNAKFPALSIMVNGDLAALHYFPRERHPGFRSVGSVSGLSADGVTTFYLNNVNEEEEVLNDAVVKVEIAKTAAKEFAHSAALPSSVQWFEL